ncbi:hypothetical protein AOQ73_19420 [Bradyrhizobium pachyrhizi]|nr:hypothetical protein AOQ73_19420 [Bradyrhizobium pachyrhizi]
MYTGRGGQLLTDTVPRELRPIDEEFLHATPALSGGGLSLDLISVLCPGNVATDMTAHATGIASHEVVQPEDLAVLVEALIRLPNRASISELLVRGQFEPML